MSIISTVTADWLGLRQGADDAARSEALAAQAAHLIAPGPVVIHDLGSGTGAMMRWLAPRLPGPQHWVLHDGDHEILARRPPGAATDASGRPVLVTTSVEPLAELAEHSLGGASLITASALLDVITLEEAAAIVAACQHAGVPALLSLTVTGDVALDPPDALDETLRAAFNDHQRRAAGDRRLLGPDAVAVIGALFDTIGWRVRTERTPWRLGPDDEALFATWLTGWAGAAEELLPDLAAETADYLGRRRAQLAAGALRAEIQHEDVIAWPR
ncbi:SAM-dependent methyltransferase [Gryllotalpicola protaetiae]|uniref:SAM-dependent methyltransferase n=1 Tax=Gryllotalpicola protaetiae TaxID=2419771 RepID=A0A387BJ91_9MICO|nr:SAM-dependent methyltransferase [Gryllotalpicola protaetiae]AYG02312.1 SAM-dependent methyltransferase [Gryllotalpicola protaetiae]